jgi:hypothetical protein
VTVDCDRNYELIGGSSRGCQLEPGLSSLPSLRRALRFSLVGMVGHEPRAGRLQALDHYQAHPFEKLEA